MPGQFAEFINAGLHIVPRGPLPAHDSRDIDTIADSLIVRDGIGRNIQSQFPLRLHYRDPQFTLQPHLAFGGPDAGNGGRGVALGEDVRYITHPRRCPWTALGASGGWDGALRLGMRGGLLRGVSLERRLSGSGLPSRIFNHWLKVMI